MKKLITIEIELKDTSTMFAVKKIIGHRDFCFDDRFTVDLNVENASLVFKSEMTGMEEVARILTGIEELGLTKEVDTDFEED